MGQSLWKKNDPDIPGRDNLLSKCGKFAWLSPLLTVCIELTQFSVEENTQE